MTMIRNPILPGFNPDPSICRVGEDYYIATSTFEWYPGVQIHHSRDLMNWRLVRRPLDRASLLDLRGEPDSCGVWAPCLTHADSRFWLVYTDVKRFEGASRTRTITSRRRRRSRAHGRIPSTSIRAASTLRSFMTTSDAKGS
jgi:beta-xylosidase